MECTLSVKLREEALEQVKELNDTGFIEFSLTETEDGWNLTAKGDSEKAETFLNEKKMKQLTTPTQQATGVLPSLFLLFVHQVLS